MLKRTKKPEDDAPFTDGETLAEPPPAPVQHPAHREGKTTIGKHISIEGRISAAENLVIEGKMKGNIEMQKHNFSVGPSGWMDGEIHALNVNISGQFKGKINALGKVEVTKEADFYGEIKAKSISIEDGAYFKGVIEMAREPHRKSTFAENAKGASSPESAKKPAAQATGA